LWATKPCKSLLISTLDKVIYYNGTFYRAQQNLSSLHKIGWRPAEKIALFFNMRVLDQDFYGVHKMSAGHNGHCICLRYERAQSPNPKKENLFICR
jgi:hypothetical protein